MAISNRVSISTFAKWQHGYVSLYVAIRYNSLFARMRHCDAEQSIR